MISAPKKIWRGNIEEAKSFWMTTLLGLTSMNVYFNDCTVTCTLEEEPESEAPKEKRFRDILDSQKRGRSVGPSHAQRDYMLTVEYAKEGEESSIIRHFKGVPMNIDRQNQFLLIDQGSYYSAHPISDLLAFSVYIPPEGIGGRPPSAVLQAAASGDASALEKHMADWKKSQNKLESQLSSFQKRKDGTAVSASDGVLDDSTLEMDSKKLHANWSSQQAKKKKISMKKKSKEAWKDEKKDWGSSALNVGQIKKSEHDWDFEGDDNATDDEDVVTVDEATVDDVDKYIGEEVEDSSLSDPDEILDESGQNIKDALNNVTELEADYELAQFSDDPEEIITMDEPESNPVKSVLPVEPVAQPTGPQDLKHRIISSLQRKGNIMQSKEFMAKFVKSKDPKDVNFILVQQIIREICEVVKKQDPETNHAKNYLQLKLKFRC